MSNQNNICNMCKKNTPMDGEKKCNTCKEFIMRNRKLQDEDYNNINEKIKKCNSRTQCDPNNLSTKAILPENYSYNRCESCIKQEK